MFKRGMQVLLTASVGLPVAAQQLSPDWAQCVNQGKAFSLDLQIGGCTAVLQSGRETAFNQAVAYKNRGRAYGHKGDYDRGIADHNEAIRLDPKDATAYYGRGNVYLDVGVSRLEDWHRAIADYNEAIRLDPSYALAYNGRGMAYSLKKDHDRAIADYSEAIRRDPSYANAYYNRGLAFEALRRREEAMADFRQVQSIGPNHMRNRAVAALKRLGAAPLTPCSRRRQ